MDSRDCYACGKKGHCVHECLGPTEEEKEKIYSKKAWNPPGWTHPARHPAAAATATAAKTLRTARKVDVPKTESGLVNVLVNEDDDTTTSSGITPFVKFKRYEAFLKERDKQSDFVFFSIH